MGAIRATFEQMGETGLGPGRGRAALTRVEQAGADESAWEIAGSPGPPSVISLDPEPAERAVRQVLLGFPTPTELKGGNGRPGGAPEFGVLFARLRDRISTLRRCTARGRSQSISAASANARAK